MVAEVRSCQLYLAAKAKFAANGDVISDVRRELFHQDDAPEPGAAATVASGFNAAASLGMIDTD